MHRPLMRPASSSTPAVAHCDALDGLKDGVVHDTLACQDVFDAETMICTDGQNGDCLSFDKVAALEPIHSGPINSAGEQLYNSWCRDPGIASGNWRFWRLESPIEPWGFKSLISIMTAGSTAQIFSQKDTNDWSERLKTNNADSDDFVRLYPVPGIPVDRVAMLPMISTFSGRWSTGSKRAKRPASLRRVSAPTIRKPATMRERPVRCAPTRRLRNMPATIR